MLRPILAAIICVSAIFFFQNCGSGVRLSKQPAPPPPPKDFAKPYGTFCADPSSVVSLPQKISFIVDMSGSNLGGDNRCNPIGDYDCYIWNYWMPGSYQGVPYKDYATDGEGLRFDAIQSFLNNCSATNPSNLYSIIPFSNNYIAPAIQKQCQSAYVDATTFAGDVSLVRAIQDADKAMGGSNHEVASYSYPFRMHDTSYTNALNCLSTKLQADITANPDQVNSYLTIFLSDGKPKEDDCRHPPPPMTEEQCLGARAIFSQCGGDITCVLVNQLKMIKYSVAPVSSDFDFQPILYTNNALVGTADYTDAKTVMLSLASVTTLPPEIPTVPVITNSGTTTPAELADLLCKSVQAGLTKSYSIDRFMAVNLTALNVKGKLESDTDMDGLSDEFEKASGGAYTFDNPRSKGQALDRLCYLNGGTCAATCDPVLPYQLGLNDCDQKFLATTYGASGTFLDSEGDGIPDFIEILKGTNPLAIDSQSDFDQDGTSNQAEIQSGTDISGSNVDYPPGPYDRMGITFTKIPGAAGCGAGQMTFQFQFKNMPLVKVGAYTQAPTTPPTRLDLSHDVDENVIALIYYAGDSRIGAKSDVYVAVVKVTVDGVVEKMDLLPADFKPSLGQVTNQ